MAKSQVDKLLEQMDDGVVAPTLEPHTISRDSAAASPPSNTVAGSFPPLWTPQKAPAHRKTMEDILVSRGLVEPEKIIQARSVQATSRGKRMGQILLEMGAAKEEDIQRGSAELMGLPYEPIDPRKVDRHAFDLLTPEFMKSRSCCCLHSAENKLTIGLADPADVFLLDELRRKLNGKHLKVVVVCASHITAAIEAGNSANAEGEKFDEIIKDMGQEELEIVEEEKEEVTDLAKASGESPVIRLVNFLIFDAIKQGASDIHIEPKEKALKIRYRIDGVLFEAMNPPHTMHAAVLSRLKIMANLDISERRLPQDGRIRAVVHGRKIDLRMSTLPTANGEKCVMRILDTKSINVALEDLGFSDDQLTIWKNQIDQPHGIVLVTGPTGSGKTTTLYSSLRCMDGNKLNISTVEDPIEYHLPAANQVQVHDKIGMSFSAALRALLRQDPDVVMLGEIRDAETARIAVQASLTGHLVLSTLHTNDAPGSITRLINIGVEPYLISAALNAILAQRLVRKICAHCKEEYQPSDEMKEFLHLQGFGTGATWIGKGCDRCRKTGYAGRLGIYELMLMDDAMRDIVTRNPDVIQLRKVAREKGLISLREDGFAKVMKGLTTVDEILRVTESTA